MTQKNVTLAGKEVTVAYCFATEIGFKKYTGKSLEEFDATDPEHSTYLILAAILAYYQSRDEEPPVKDEDIIYNASPKEIVSTLATIFKMRAEWYELPFGEPKSEEGDKTKNP